jgi:serine protease AprX
MSRVFSKTCACARTWRVFLGVAGCLGALSLVCGLSVTGAVAAVPGTDLQPGLADRPSALADVLGTDVPLGLADRDGNKIFDTLDARLQSARPDDSFDVVVSFAVPMQPADVLRLQVGMGAFGPAQSLGLVNAAALRLTAVQVLALARAGIVATIEPDEEMVAFRAAAMQWFGVTGARADFGFTGDGDGKPDSFTPADNTIAIVDTGIDSGHVELNGGKVIGWVDFVNNRATPYDDEGHGTHVASIAAGKPVDSSGGVAPGAALVGVKVLDSRGSGSMSRVAQGIDWCVQNRTVYGIRVINISLGSTGSSDGTDVVSRSADAAVAAGITVVVAAGNEGPQTRTVGSPAAARGVIAVGAVADPDAGGVYVPSFSSRGPTADGRVKPDIVAPGVNISAAKANSTNGYVTFSGTSMATPFVAGVVALMLEETPTRTPADVYSGITQTARDFGPPGLDSDYGYGLLDAYAALRPSPGIGAHIPLFPVDDMGSGAITATQRAATHTFQVTSTQYPIAITLVIANWSRSNTNLDAELLDPSGRRVALSDGRTRQETLSWKPQQTGTYTLRVFGFRSQDNASYFFDISADLAPGGTALGASP